MNRRRADLGLSQEDAASRAGVNRTTWIAWEHVDELPHRKKWPAIAKVLEMQIDELQKAAATSWFLQCGPSPFQLQALQAMGISFENAIPTHAFSDPGLFKLDNELEVDLERLPHPLIAQRFGQLRHQIRNLLIAQDTTSQTTMQLVRGFREIFEMIALRNPVPITAKKTTKFPKNGNYPRKGRGSRKKSDT